MFYVYVLVSEKDGNLYTGVTSDLARRLNEHQHGKVRSTKGRRPLRLVYKEEFDAKHEALAREAYFKTAEGGVLKRRLLSEEATKSL
jgi:putative endonuclease